MEILRGGEEWERLARDVYELKTVKSYTGWICRVE